jgi:hypothetical protein
MFRNTLSVNKLPIRLPSNRFLYLKGFYTVKQTCT